MPEAHVVRPQPGDIVVYKVDKDFKGSLAEVAEDIRGLFPNNQVIVTNDGSIDVWTDEDLKSLGLQRIPR